MTESSIENRAVPLAYRLLRRFVAFLASVFFRQIEVVGEEHVPANGPVIFAGNHPNSLLDPALIIALAERQVHFAAKDVLFKSALLRPVLRNLGAIPIARRADHGGGESVDNENAFGALFAVLAAGGAMGIFPEGLSHDDSQLARLKTGAARIALGVAARGTTVQIVPCGLNYVHKKRFRSRVLLQFGPPIEVRAEDVSAAGADDRERVRDITTRIDAAIRALTVNSSDWETLRVLDGVRRLYQPSDVPLDDRIELSRRFASVYETVKDRPDIAPLVTRVTAYLDRLRALGLSDRDLRRNIGKRDASVRFVRHLVLMFVWLPFALPGLPIFFALGVLVRYLWPHLTPRKDVLATTKLMAGLLGSIAAFVAVPFAVWWRFGVRAALAAGAVMLLSGFATLRVVERGTALRDLGKTFLRLAFFSDEVKALRAERTELEKEIVAAVDRHRPADMVPVVNRGASTAAGSA